MISFKKIKRLVRSKENDNSELQFSDYQIMDAVNEVLRYVSMSQAMNNSDFLNKGISYDMHHDHHHGLHSDYRGAGVELPDDFVSIVAVYDHRGYKLQPCPDGDTPRHHEYKVSASKIYVGVPSFKMMYKGMLDEVDDEHDKIKLPQQFTDFLVKMTRMVLKQTEDDIMQTAIDVGIENLIPKRKYSNVRIRLPFRIG